jgi:hypothetical protein
MSIPKTQTAGRCRSLCFPISRAECSPPFSHPSRPPSSTLALVIFYEHNGPLSVVKDHPVIQQKDMKPGEALVRIVYTGVRPFVLLFFLDSFHDAPSLE